MKAIKNTTGRMPVYSHRRTGLNSTNNPKAPVGTKAVRNNSGRKPLGVS